MSAPELLPCPFCGHGPYTDADTARVMAERTGHLFAVACSHCEVSAPGADVMGDAIAAWNTRADLAPQWQDIATALPDMVAPLVWRKSKKNPLVSTAKTNFGPQYTMRISLSWGAIWSVDAVKGWHSASDEDAAKAAANAHHAAAVVAAITGEQP